MEQRAENTSFKLLERGFTLIELMIVIAILAILAAIAIPAYNQYIAEARYSSLRATMDSMRVFLEDYRLENLTYTGPNATSGNYTTLANITTDFGWEPDGVGDSYTYRLETSATGFNIAINDGNVWLRCENRMDSCCDSSMTGPLFTDCDP